MNLLKPGMLALSQAGHDQGTLYIIMKVEKDFLYLTDGRLKPLENPKKKKIKHIQIIKTMADELIDPESGSFIGNIKNEDIRKVIRRYADV